MLHTYGYGYLCLYNIQYIQCNVIKYSQDIATLSSPSASGIFPSSQTEPPVSSSTPFPPNWNPVCSTWKRHRVWHSRVHRAVLTFHGVCGGKREAINFDFFFLTCCSVFSPGDSVIIFPPPPPPYFPESSSGSPPPPGANSLHPRAENPPSYCSLFHHG